MGEKKIYVCHCFLKIHNILILCKLKASTVYAPEALYSVQIS